MNYSPESFAALFAEIEEIGGALLPDLCATSDIHYESPPYNKDHVEKRVTQYCNNMSRFAVPYETEKGAKTKAQFASVCAVCDGIGAWPRFREVVNGAAD